MDRAATATIWPVRNKMPGTHPQQAAPLSLTPPPHPAYAVRAGTPTSRWAIGADNPTCTWRALAKGQPPCLQAAQAQAATTYPPRRTSHMLCRYPPARPLAVASPPCPPNFSNRLLPKRRQASRNQAPRGSRLAGWPFAAYGGNNSNRPRSDNLRNVRCSAHYPFTVALLLRASLPYSPFLSPFSPHAPATSTAQPV